MDPKLLPGIIKVNRLRVDNLKGINNKSVLLSNSPIIGVGQSRNLNKRFVTKNL